MTLWKQADSKSAPLIEAEIGNILRRLDTLAGYYAIEKSKKVIISEYKRPIKDAFEQLKQASEYREQYQALLNMHREIRELARKYQNVITKNDISPILFKKFVSVLNKTRHHLNSAILSVEQGQVAAIGRLASNGEVTTNDGSKEKEDARRIGKLFSLIRREAGPGPVNYDAVRLRDGAIRLVQKYVSAGRGIPSIIAGLKHENRSVRAICAFSLQFIRIQRQDVISGLKDALSDSDEQVRRLARGSLETIEKGTQIAIYAQIAEAKKNRGSEAEGLKTGPRPDRHLASNDRAGESEDKGLMEKQTSANSSAESPAAKAKSTSNRTSIPRTNSFTEAIDRIRNRRDLLLIVPRKELSLHDKNTLYDISKELRAEVLIFHPPKNDDEMILCVGTRTQAHSRPYLIEENPAYTFHTHIGPQILLPSDFPLPSPMDVETSIF